MDRMEPVQLSPPARPSLVSESGDVPYEGVQTIELPHLSHRHAHQIPVTLSPSVTLQLPGAASAPIHEEERKSTPLASLAVRTEGPPPAPGAGVPNFGEEDLELEVEQVRLVNVHKTYLLGIEGVPALRGVSMSVRRGELVMILGTSGGGKTTMLNIIGTIDKPTKGEVTLCGVRVTSKTSDDTLAALRLNRIAFVFQTFNLISSMSALENVELPMLLRGDRSRDAIRARATDLLTRVGLAARLHHLPNQLSGGEQQRVTIARALANQPELLLLDEPTGDLDTRNTELVLQLLLELNARERITMIMVTHDVGLKQFAHRVVRMLDGKIQRIEKVPRETRRGAYQSLLQAIAVHEKTGVREGVAAAPGMAAEELRSDRSAAPSEASTEESLTELRKPADYPAVHFARTPLGASPAATGTPGAG